MSNVSFCQTQDCLSSLRASQPIVTWATFLFIALASKIVGAQCQRIGFPAISGYLLTGIICGPDALQILQRAELPRLIYINDFVIAYISTSAGSELYIPHVSKLLQSVLINTSAIGVLTLPLCTIVGFGMGGTILLPWQGSYSDNCKWAMSAVAGGIYMGRSPASVIAIIAELKVRQLLNVPYSGDDYISIVRMQAQGDLTSTMLGITVCSDVLVLLAVTFVSAIAAPSCSGERFDGVYIGIVVVILNFHE